MSEPPLVRVARFLDRTTAEGPGERTAIWVQGCTIRCAGCFNPHLFGVRGGVPTPPADLVARVLATGTPGLTLLGGEPFEQAAGLAAVATGVRRAGRSVMTFTGYEYDQLREQAASGRDDVAALLDATDLLVAGLFRQDLLDHDRPWVGSTNQRFIRLSDRIEDVPIDVAVTPDRLEVTVTASGAVSVNGWADIETLDALLSGLPARRGKPA
ncbi:4Fe-4S single cluster domain-containing protein [Actinoplanes aureus]|uniref:Radical SAM protein n=1 Tax=Actinoplanes aureus TaxID=2792083 RepID=A0A931CA42_9ACTN|nr:4Fe-4S single cluster domain-containing protein [Actinoplanes aureus]MBG0564949.1 radical SAM protein [Actinoplanes aureus]